MADEEIGEVALLLQVAQQIDDLRLHRHVERAGRLVEHDELRLQHHGARDGDALALAAGELVRVAVLGQSDRGPTSFKRGADALAALLIGRVRALDQSALPR